MIHIPNRSVLQDVLRQSEATTVEELAAIVRDVFPMSDFHLVGKWEDWHREGGIVTAGLERVAHNRKDWMRELVKSAGDEPRSAWVAVKPRGLISTRWQGTTLIFTAPFGKNGPGDFFQLMIDMEEEVTESWLVEDQPPEDLEDLLYPICLDRESAAIVTPRVFASVRLVHAGNFIQEMARARRLEREKDLPSLQKRVVRWQNIYQDGGPSDSQEVPFLEIRPNYVDEPLPQARLLLDWAASSPGKTGAILCRRWFFDYRKVKDQKGGHSYSCIPCWASGSGAKELPELRFRDDESPFVVMDQLEQFDSLAGYPFAWYFYMLHGNRISALTGEIVAGALREGTIRLPDHDAEVLLKWEVEPYGF